MSETNNTKERGLRKTRIGVVVSDKMDKTVTIQIKTRVRHPLYGKIMNQTSKLKVHDENNECGVGDTIRVMETRPLSHDKRWAGLSGVTVPSVMSSWPASRPRPPVAP